MTDDNLTIVLIEDNDDDAFITEYMLSKVDDSCNIKRFSNGLKAIKYLLSKNDTSLPAIILDLNMPVMNGLEFLENVRSNEKLKDLVITVLTSSIDTSDVKFCEAHDVKRFYVKPIDKATSKEIISIAKVV